MKKNSKRNFILICIFVIISILIFCAYKFQWLSSLIKILDDGNVSGDSVFLNDESNNSGNMSQKDGNNENKDVRLDNASESGDAKQISITGVKVIGDIEVSNVNISLVSKDKCEFVADVKNTTDKFLEATSIRIKVIDETGEVDEIFGGVITELAGYEPSKFKTIVLADITDAVDIEFEIIQ